MRDGESADRDSADRARSTERSTRTAPIPYRLLAAPYGLAPYRRADPVPPDRAAVLGPRSALRPRRLDLLARPAWRRHGRGLAADRVEREAERALEGGPARRGALLADRGGRARVRHDGRADGQEEGGRGER